MTPGLRSSEFWFHVASFVAGCALAVAGIVLARDVVVCAGSLWAAASALGYGHGRSVTKAPRPYLDPPRRV